MIESPDSDLMMLLEELSAGPQGNVTGGGVRVAVDPGRDAWEGLELHSREERQNLSL